MSASFASIRASGAFWWSLAFSTALASSAFAQAPSPTPDPAPAEVTPAPAAPTPALVVTPTPAPGAAEAAAPATPTAPPSDAAVDAAAAGVEEQVVQDATGSASGDEYKLDIYGFTDFTYVHYLERYPGPNPSYDSFAVGHMNVYLASELGDHWRSLAEVRFSYLPSGNIGIDSTGQGTRTDTSAADYADGFRPLQWGGIVLERAYLEYSAHPLFNIRGGHWITPYGIWNVDHGSPVIIGVLRPYIIGDSLFPTSQTGLELYGKHNFPAFEVGYHLTLSNGRGPIDKYQDLNNNKAIGGRLFAHADTPAGSFTLGASVYAGRYTDRTLKLGDPSGSEPFLFPRTNEYREISWAGDLKWEWSGYLLQGEVIVNQMKYGDLRPAITPPFGSGLSPDIQRWGAYGLTGYRFDFLGIMPFGEVEYYDSGPALLGRSSDFVLGLNVRPSPRVVLKGSWIYATFRDFPSSTHYDVLNFQAAWSF